MPSLPVTVYAAVSGYISRRAAIRAAIRTERVIGALPAQMRKDIGWPDLWTGPDRWRR
jgi:hypothetical protein